MKKIEMIIRPDRMEELVEALDKCGVNGMTVYKARANNKLVNLTGHFAYFLRSPKLARAPLLLRFTALKINKISLLNLPYLLFARA